MSVEDTQLNEHWKEQGWKRGEGDTMQIYTTEENIKGKKTPAWALCVQLCFRMCEMLETTKVAQ